jgi:hypothetical protein
MLGSSASTALNAKRPGCAINERSGALLLVAE